MAFNFPASPSNGDTTIGPNGLQYTFDSSHGCWTIVLTEPIYDDTAVLGAIETEKVRNNTQDTNISSNDVDIANLQNKVDDLGEKQGESLSYKIEAIDTQVSTRAGDMHVNNANPNNITIISLAATDADGVPIGTPHTGDTILFSRIIGNTKQEHRYITTDSNNSAQVMNVSLVFTTGETIVADDVFEIYLYPTNTSSASTEYVDDADKIVQDQVDVLKTDKVNKSGDTMTGRLLLKRPTGSSAPLGLEILGVQENGTDTGAILFDVNHNATGGDAIRYYGKTNGNSHIQTKESVDAKLGIYTKLTGGILTGTLTSKLGGTNSTSFYITNEKNTQQAWQLWCPGGAGSQVKYVTRHDTAHWFQMYDENNDNPLTKVKIEYNSIDLVGNTNIGYGISDAHYLKGSVIVNSSGDVQLFRINNGGGIKANTSIEVDGPITINDSDLHMDGGMIVFDKPDKEVTIDARKAQDIRILTGTGEDNYFKVANGSAEKFKVTGTGTISGGSSAGSPFLATENHHLTTKKYVDDKVDGSAGNIGGPFLPLSGGTMTGNLDLGGKIIKSPKNPTSDLHIGSRAYNDARYWQGPITSNNATMGINYKGQACVDGTNGTPTAGSYQTGALIWSTVSNTLYVKG